MKKTYCTIILMMCASYISAQIKQPAEPRYTVTETETHGGEYFMFDTVFSQIKNYEFYAEDSIVLTEGFSRLSFAADPHHLPAHFYTEMVVDELGVHPPYYGQQGGSNEGDKGVVGSLGGTIDVGLMGGAVYSIPIDLPAGINGLQPSLAITYNSQGGNGLMGWKWDLVGLSSITRSGKTRYHDGSVGGITLNDYIDCFLLDGQRLIKTQQQFNYDEFKIEQDDNSRIRAYYELKNGYRYIGKFKVWKANGTIFEYGYTVDSRIIAQDDRLGVVSWLVNKIIDRNGNAIQFFYNTNYQSGEYYIRQIQYTANDALGIKPEFIVDFIYSNTNILDYTFKYIGGNILQKKKCLEHINISHNDGSNPLEQYTFVYESDVHPISFDNFHRIKYDSVQTRHRLSKIYYQNGDDALNPTRISWTSTGDNSVLQHWDISDTAIYNNYPFVGDFNADGYSDLVVVPFKGDTMYYQHDVAPKFFLNNKSQGFDFADISMETQPKSLDWIYVIDINDDGYDDLVTVCYDSTSNLGRTDIMVYKNRHSQDNISFEPVWEKPMYVNSKVKIALGDFLGEGKRSLLIFGINAAGNAAKHCKYVPCSGGWCYTYDVAFETGNVIPAHQIEAGEYLGDGCTEIFVMGESNSSIWKLAFENNGYLLKKKLDISDITFSDENARSQVFSGDFNGDGLTDLLAYHHEGNYEHGQNIWNMYFATGKGLVNAGFCPDLNYYIMPKQELYGNSLRKLKNTDRDSSWYSICISDFDGDGVSDVAVIKNAVVMGSSLDIYFNFKPDTRKFLSWFAGSWYNGSGHGVYINCKTQYLHVGRFVNKENCSFLGLQKKEGINSNDITARTPKIYSLKPVGELNNVSKIIDGLGNVLQFDYDMLLQEYKYYGYGVRGMAVPYRILKTSTIYNAAGKPMRTQHSFSGPCIHRDGHGFLGFREVTTKTSNNANYINASTMKYSLEVMKDYALLLPSTTETYVYPNDNENSVRSSKITYHFLNAVNSENSLVTCPALVKKELKRYNVDNPSAGMLSKEITENDYNYLLNADGQSATYTHEYNCTETRTGVHSTNVDDVADCDFRTTTTNEFYDIQVGSWILARTRKQVTTQSITGKEDKVNTIVLEYASNYNYQIRHKTDIPNTEQTQDRQTINTDYLYYPTGNLQSETISAPYGDQDEPQRTTMYEYGDDNKGRLVTKETIIAGELEYETSYSYDAHDNIDTIVDQNGLVTSYNTNPIGITSLTTNPDNTVIGEAYRWATGHSLAPANAAYYHWTHITGKEKQLTFYHKSGEVLRTVTFGPKTEAIITDILYNNRGLPEAVSNPYFEGETVQWTKYEYDRLERLATITTPDEATTNIIHQGLVTRTTISDGNGNEQKTKRTDNIMGWMVSNRDPQDVTVKYDYYADGSLAYTQIGDNTASRIVIGYDNRGNRNSLTDPDYGTTASVYDAYGNLKQRTSPKADVFSYQYDPMGRLIEKHDSSENTTTTFVFDETEGLKGTLKSITHGDNQSIQYDYDRWLRLVSVGEQLFGTIYKTRLYYDEVSRINQITYPTGVTVQNEYSAFGHLNIISDANGNPLWEANQTNAMGQLLQSTMGGQIVTNRLFDSKMHYIKGITTSNNLQNLSYGYDKFGNLARRTDSLRMMTETFQYDRLNRLTEIYFGDHRCKARYDNLGRMILKQGLVWKYGGPHVQTIFSAPQFDEEKIHAMNEAVAHPDWFSPDPLSIDYTSFDKIRLASSGDNEVSFQYGFNEERIRMSESDDTWERQKTFVGSCEFITESDANGTTEKSWTFLTCPLGVFAVVEQQDGEETLHYILKDHQGNWTVIVDADGEVEQELSYDAWGNLRDPETWCVDASIMPMFDRGYTGHEHLNGFGLINMNGRMYDPVMSSFLSVDRYVQQPDNSQGFNRYAYCMYNPLKYVDPSGWMMSGPSGSGGIPPQFKAPQPAAVDGGYRLVEIDGVLYGGCLIDTYAIDYACTSSSGGNNQAEQDCRELIGEQNHGVLFEEYPDEANVPTIRAGGGGGGWGTNYAGSPSKDYGIASNSLSYGVSYAGVVTGYKRDLWEKPRSRAQKAINQKKAYNTQKALKAKGITKHVKEIKATNGAKLAKASRSCALLGVGLEVADIGINHQLNTSNLVNGAVAVISIWVAPVGIVYLGVELGSWIFTGNTFSEHIDNWCKEPLYEW